MKAGWNAMLLALVTSACTALLGDDFVVSDGSGGAGAAGGAAAGGGGSGAGAVGGNGGSGVGGDCASDVVEAQQVPLDLVLVIDRSGSMGTGGRWDVLVEQFTEFFNAPGWASMSVAINYFAAPGAADECAVAEYDPPQVGLTPLSFSAQSLIDDLASQAPQGTTPTRPAMVGSLDFASAHHAANPEREVVAVLLTDGLPNVCNPSLQLVADRAAAAFQEGVSTFAIALEGILLSDLDPIAQAGGTEGALDGFDMTTLRPRMDEVRDRALRCGYQLPAEVTDPLLVNVTYLPSGAPPKDLPKAADEGDCGGGEGWYYDDPNVPRRVLFCPQSCAQITADPEPRVEVLVGCPSVEN